MRVKGRIVSTIVGVSVVVGGWFLLAPPQLGGHTRMLAIEGASMEPNWHAGDLALVRARSSYAVGDVVAYRSETVGVTMLHRIVAIEEGRYTLQGDANGFLDPDRPTIDAILGASMLRIPNGAIVLRAMSSPAAVAMFAGLFVFLTMIRRTRATDPDDKRRKTMRSQMSSRVLAAGSKQTAPVAAIALLTVAFVATGIGAAAATMGSTPQGEAVGFTNHGTFAYTARSSTGVYPDGVARTGDAVFTRAGSRVRISFAYAFASAASADLQGRIALRAQLTDVAGWNRFLTLRPETPFSGTAASVTGILDLRRLDAMVERFTTETGVVRSTFQVILQPAVELEGAIGGVAYKDAFTPTMTLEYDRLALRPAASIDPGVDQTMPSIAGQVTVPGGSADASMTIAGRTLPARSMALAMGLVAVMAGAIAWILLRASRRASDLDVPARMRARFAHRIVALERLPEQPTIAVADAAGFERLVEASDEPLLEHEDRYGVSWLMRDGETMYAFRIETVRSAEVVLTPDAEFARFLSAQ